jgi:hypothetical protein
MPSSRKGAGFSKDDEQDATSDADRSFDAHAAHLLCCDLRCSLTHQRMRALRCSAAPSTWTTWPPNLSAGPLEAS